MYEEVFEIIEDCLAAQQSVSQEMWGIFELLYNTMKETGIDFMEEALPSFHCFVSYGKEAFAESSRYQNLLFDLITTVMRNDRAHETEHVVACQLMESVLLNCTGRVDHFIQPFISLVIEYCSKIDEVKRTELKACVLNVVINALHYNFVLTLQVLEQNGWTEGFFATWFSHLGVFRKVYDKKLVIIALSELLVVPVEQLPESLRAAWPQLLTTILSVFKTLPQAEQNLEHAKKLLEGEEEETLSSDGCESAEEDHEDEDENVLDEANEYLEMLSSEAARLAAEADDDDDETDSIELGEDPTYETPLNNLDAYVKFKQTFTELQQYNPTGFQIIEQGLGQDDKCLIETIFAEADRRLKQFDEAKLVETCEPSAVGSTQTKNGLCT